MLTAANPVLETPPKITFGITETCPLRCSYCYADCARAPKEGELNEAQWIALIKSLNEQGVIQVYIEGGEPLAKPGFMNILRAATPTMMTMMRTHGAGLTHDVAQELADIGLGRSFVDLMGADAATHDAATGTPGSLMKPAPPFATWSRPASPRMYWSFSPAIPRRNSARSRAWPPTSAPGASGCCGFIRSDEPGTGGKSWPLAWTSKPPPLQPCSARRALG